jgi:hypothetical protein
MLCGDAALPRELRAALEALGLLEPGLDLLLQRALRIERDRHEGRGIKAVVGELHAQLPALDCMLLCDQQRRTRTQRGCFFRARDVALERDHALVQLLLRRTHDARERTTSSVEAFLRLLRDQARAAVLQHFERLGPRDLHARSASARGSGADQDLALTLQHERSPCEVADQAGGLLRAREQQRKCARVGLLERTDSCVLELLAKLLHEAGCGQPLRTFRHEPGPDPFTSYAQQEHRAQLRREQRQRQQTSFG